MKLNHKIILFLFTLFFLGFSFLRPDQFVKAQQEEATASSVVSEKVVSIGANEVITRDFYVTTGEVVEIFGTVEGDLIALGGQLLVDGNVTGDLIAIGGTVKVTGQVGQDLRVIGGQVSVSGSVGQNVLMIGGSLDLERTADLGKGLILIGGNGNLLSPVRGNVLALVGNLTVAGMIQGDLETAAGNLRLSSGTVVGGNLTYNNDASFSEAGDVVIRGETIVKEYPFQAHDFDFDVDTEIEPGGIMAALAVFRFWRLAVSFVSAVVFGLLALKYFPVLSLKAAQTLQKSPWRSLGFGLLAVILGPLSTFVLAITVFGLPLAGVVFLLFLLLVYLAKIMVALWLAYRLGGQKDLSGLRYSVALLIIYFIFFIPVLGGITKLLVLVFGAGQMVLTKKEAYSLARKAKIY